MTTVVIIMFFSNIREASFATHPGLFAHFSQFGQCFFGMRQLLLCKADLAESRSATNVHSRTAGWPFMGLGLLLAPPVWVSHTTSHLVEAEEAPFAVTRDPVMPNSLQSQGIQSCFRTCNGRSLALFFVFGSFQSRLILAFINDSPKSI